MMRGLICNFFFFFNDTATTEIYTLSLHDALPIWGEPSRLISRLTSRLPLRFAREALAATLARSNPLFVKSFLRSEEHTSELQSRLHLVCRLLLEKKKYTNSSHHRTTPAITPRHVC